MTKIDIAGSYVTTCDFGAKNQQTKDDLIFNDLLFLAPNAENIPLKFTKIFSLQRHIKTVPN
jgi:hypothetical protein